MLSVCPGDLKTFLLARRQLVGQKTKEAEDVSPENLTRMALDIAYGLQYLRDLHYVHRCVGAGSVMTVYLFFTVIHFFYSVYFNILRNV